VPSIRQAVRRSGRLTALARGVRDAIRGVPPPPPREAPPVAGLDGVAELHWITPRRAKAGTGPRLNLLIPTLASRRAFGGTRTALDLFDALADRFPRRRIVSFTPVPTAVVETLEGFVVANAADDRTPDRVIVAATGGSDAELAVGPDDVFLATFWTTAELAARLSRWQASTFGGELRAIAYLVQDYEPGFYPWSAQFELARATYATGVPTIAVVNSGLLADYLDEQGLTFAERFVFEPRLDERLRAMLANPATERRRRIVAYGRPGTPRNAFPLVVDGLRAWVRRGGAGGWEVVSAGEPHPPVDLGRGIEIGRLGKLSIDAYGALLRESAVGLSLMVSPHPSYPPLDMAHLGLRVVTNRFGPKDLSAWHENIVSVASMTADSIADALAAQAAAYDADPGAGDRARPLRPDYLADGPPFPFADTLAEHLGAGL
jgi:WsaF, C-terminal domain/WsaF, N-terminal domain